MIQYFYLVNHTSDNETRVNDKIFLQEEKAINWGRKQATKFPENNYWLQRCPITTTGIISDYKSLFPFKTILDDNNLIISIEEYEN